MSWFLKGFLMTDIFHMYWLFVITTNSLLFKACKKGTQTQVHRHYHFLAHKANYMLNEILNKVTTCLHSTTAHNPHFWNCFLRTKNKSEARYNWLCCYTIWCAVLMGWKRNLQKNWKFEKWAKYLYLLKIFEEDYFYYTQGHPNRPR